MKIGILAIQGGFKAHANIINKLGVNCCYVRQADDLAVIHGLIIPGGESTTLLKFLLNNPLFDAIKQLPLQNKPVFGTCAGAILLAKQVKHPRQSSLGLINMTIERNAYGRQIDSHISKGVFCPDNSEMEMVFIRAPRIDNIDNHADVIARCDNDPVCVMQNSCLAAMFHPELGEDDRLHQFFLNMVSVDRARS